MTALNESVIKNLEENPKDIYIEGIIILLRLLENVIKDPENSKYRTIRLENKIIKEKLLCLTGALQALSCIGFEQIADELKLPASVLTAKLKKYRDFIKERLESVRNKPSASEPKLESPTALNISVDVKVETSTKNTGAIRKNITKISSTVPFNKRIEFAKVVPFNNQFLQHIELTSDQVMQYEDDKLKYYGKQLIPIEKLSTITLGKLRIIQKSILSDKLIITEPCFSDFLLVELVNWFNTSFFTWINSMPCRNCGNEDVQTKGGYVDRGIRVETYTCCNETSKFYRYNDIEALLRTRKGRCGEYANCFTFFCRCLGYDARLVYATFDHVWTEVYSVSQKRWLHIDPSDNVIDAPLMYQHGWKRNVDYIIAFSRDDVQDVTWRYTNNHDDAKLKRKTCLEEDLLQAIILLREKRQSKCSPARIKYLRKRTLMELVELMLQKELTDNEKKGRSSGSLNWKLSRGEQNVNNFYVFNAHQDEHTSKQFNLRYSCSKNIYERYILLHNDKINVIETKNTWETWHHISSNIFRKEERDWKMVYLARAEDTESATISWSFDFAQLKIKTIKFKFETKTYENGIVELMILNENGVNINSIQGLENMSKFSIKALLSGGKGENSWQHTQLFRQRIAANDFPFEINITFH